MTKGDMSSSAGGTMDVPFAACAWASAKGPTGNAIGPFDTGSALVSSRLRSPIIMLMKNFSSVLHTNLVTLILRCF